MDALIHVISLNERSSGFRFHDIPSGTFVIYHPSIVKISAPSHLSGSPAPIYGGYVVVKVHSRAGVLDLTI